MPLTYADASALERDFGFTPKIPLRVGLRKFAEGIRSIMGDGTWEAVVGLNITIGPLEYLGVRNGDAYTSERDKS